MQINVRKRWIQGTVAGLLVVSACGAWGVWKWIDRYLVLAQRAVDDGDWKQARDDASIYLKFKPSADPARILIAEALIRDNSIPGDTKIYDALEQLNRIPEESSLAADARLYEGRLHLLLLLQPGEAEKCFLRSLKHDPKRMETHSLLWRLYDLTTRWDLAEAHFWSIYDRTPLAERETPLRNWYLSEFGPGAANVELDRNLGFVNQAELPDAGSERRRLEAFVTAEPQWTEGYVILARWFQRHKAVQEALSLLERAERLPDASTCPMLIVTRVAIDIEFGEFDRALQVFERWPIPREGYEYWKTAGLVADQILRDNQRARDAYEQAIETTPGKSDWPTQHRLALCLTRMGEAEKAARVRKRSRQVESLMEPAIHARIRKALSTPRDPQTIVEMVDLYQKLERHREVAAWQQLRPVEHPRSSAAIDLTLPVMVDTANAATNK